MEDTKKVCVVVPIFNRLEITVNFIKASQQSSYKNYTIYIFDDGSDGTGDYIRKNFPDVVVKNGDGSYMWSGATNEGVKYAIENNYDYVLTINNDSTPDKDLLKNLVEYAQKNPDSIIAGRVMLEDSDKVWSMGTNVNFLKHPYLELNMFGIEESHIDLNMQITVDALPGNGVLVPVSVYKKIGLYNHKWCPLYHGDTELTYRATKAGIRCIVEPKAVLKNNHFVADQGMSICKALTSVNSTFYWRPTLYFYFKHAPFLYKIFYLKQLLWIPKRIIKELLGRK